MMRWLLFLVLAIIAEVMALLLAPFLPAFARPTIGPVDNNSASNREPRLPWWLSWFQTPDNSLLGDAAWRAGHSGTYLHQVAWLLRNRAYGFKWSVLACQVDPLSIVFEGNPFVNRNNGVAGLFRARCGAFWQWKLVKPLVGRLGIMWNFGWQLDEFTRANAKPGRALFQFSPRFVSIQQGGV